MAGGLWLVGYLLILGVSGGAHAQGNAGLISAQDTATARALFQEGVAFADAGNWEDARDRFARAHSLRPSSGIAFNLACAEVELGQLVLASEHFRGVIQDPASSSELKNEARTKLEALSPRLAYLTVHVEGASPDAQLLIDESPVPRAAWDVATPVDPGMHRLSVREAGRLLSSDEIELAEGERRETSLVAASTPESAPRAVAEDAKPLSEPTRSDSQPLYKNPWLWTGVGAAAAAAVVAVVLLSSRGPTEKEEAPVMGNAGQGIITW